VIESSLKEGATVTRRSPLARIQQADGKIVEVRSPLPGRINKILKANGSQVSQGEEVLSLNSDEGSVWEALRALSIIGTKEDLPLVETYAKSADASARVKEQASLTLNAINHR
jgi:pyruvate/2-oxoglutarate dehydrogenase complex dihydrolipoamide acyltransferase (E2) component